MKALFQRLSNRDRRIVLALVLGVVVFALVAVAMVCVVNEFSCKWGDDAPFILILFAVTYLLGLAPLLRNRSHPAP